MVWYDIDTRELSSVYMIELSSVYIIPNHLGLRSPGSEYAAVLRRKRVCVHISAYHHRCLYVQHCDHQYPTSTPVATVAIATVTSDLGGDQKHA